MSQTLKMCSERPIWGRFTTDGLYLVSEKAQFKTPYGGADFADGQYDVDRVVWCLLTELGYFAFPDRWKPEQGGIGPYTLGNYVRGLAGVLGDLQPWLMAMEADLELETDLEWQWSVRQSSNEPFSAEFQLGLLPNDVLWDELYRYLIGDTEDYPFRPDPT